MTADINNELVRVSSITKVDILHVGEEYSAIGVWLLDKIAVINYPKSDLQRAYDDYRMLRIAVKHYK